MRCLGPLIAVLLCGCTAWQRSEGESHYTTPLTFAVPDPEHPLANLDPDFPVAPSARPQTSTSPPPRPARPRLSPRVHRATTHNVSLTLFTFDDRDFTFAIADMARGPGTEWQSARDAARQLQAVAAINGGFFTPDGQPLGLVIENGVRFGSWNRASSLTSGVLAVSQGRPQLLRRQHWPSSVPTQDLIQAGPLLLEKARIVKGLSGDSRRPRSFLAWDGRHRWAIGAATSATLADLAAALASQPVPASRFTTALNLDGGRSSDLWISSAIEGGPLATRRFWNNPVRNYVLIRKRSPPS